MCQDPEIAFVLIMLPFKRKQFAFDLQSEQFFTIFLVLSNSLYFLVTDADVIACFLLKAWTFQKQFKKIKYRYGHVENNLRNEMKDKRAKLL